MVGAGSAALLLVSSILHRGSFAATLNAEKESVVRREPQRRESDYEDGRPMPIHRVQLGSKGDMVSHGHDVQATLTEEQQEELNEAFCNTDYPVGKDGSNNCTNPDEQILRDEGKCIEAAKEVGAKQEGQDWKFDQATDSPQGCFKDNCKAPKTGTCYFYNGLEDPPGAIVAPKAPICWRPKYLNATAKDVCPDRYTLINKDTAAKDENTCRSVAACLGYTASDNKFQVGETNPAEKTQWVTGCFINDDPTKLDDVGAYFNPGSGAASLLSDPNATGGNATGGGAKLAFYGGTQICQVSATTPTWGNDAAGLLRK